MWLKFQDLMLNFHYFVRTRKSKHRIYWQDVKHCFWYINPIELLSLELTVHQMAALLSLHLSRLKQ